MNKGSLKLTETLEIAIQIASALQAAHQAGIIHRDIKPDNVMIRADGYVKVLDFGLAKLAGPFVAMSGIDSSEDSTRMQVQTQSGVIIGTVAYMSPEQARGQEVDARTDIWSLGCLLYEMVVGQHPFKGETTADALANIIYQEPVPIHTLSTDAPDELQRISNQTLKKNKSERYQTATALLADLKQLQKRLDVKAELARSDDEDRTQIIRAQITTSMARTNSIAVLPFANLSVDQDNEFFCDGLAEELLNALAKIDHLKVAARTSAFSFKGKNTNVSEIAEKLGVSTVLEGSVRRSGNRLRIMVQLVNAATGYQLWSERYDREIQDIFDVQDEITLAIIAALKVKLFVNEKAAVLKRYTGNTVAYQLYLQGRYHWNKYAQKGLGKAIEYFRQAIEEDHTYALAYAGLADSYYRLSNVYLPTREAMPKAKLAAMRAIEMDDMLAEAHAALGLVLLFYDWDWLGAEREFSSAVELNPGYAIAHQRLALYFNLLGRFDDATHELQRAIELDPLSLQISQSVAWEFFLKGDYEQAIRQMEKTLEMNDMYHVSYYVLGWIYKRKGDLSKSLKNFERAAALDSSPIFLAALGHVRALKGDRTRAFGILDVLEEQSKTRYVSSYCRALVYIGLNDNDQAFLWLEKAAEERSEMLPWLKIGPEYDGLRSDPRYQNLLRRVGFAP